MGVKTMGGTARKTGHYNPADAPEVINGIQEAYGFKRGDAVEYTNSHGLIFSPHKVIGFVQNPRPDDWGRVVFIDSDSPWFPVRPESLRKLEATQCSQQ